MYRAPKTSSSGAPGILMLVLVLLGALYFAGCADVGTAPDLDVSEEVNGLELELATDEELAAVLLDDVESTLGAGAPTASVVGLETAESAFAGARDAAAAGDEREAVRRGLAARRALAGSLVAGGDRTVEIYLERTRSLLDRMRAGDGIAEFSPASDVLGRIAGTGAAIDSDLARGDRVAAVERAVRANQEADRDRARRHDRDPGPFARFSVAMGWEAVEHAGRLLEDDDATGRQEQLLAVSVRMAESAQVALDAGRYRRAIALSQRAVSLSLMAVVHPEVTEEDAAEIEALALAELEAAAARDLTEFEEKILARARATFDSGVEAIRSGDLRGVKLVWRAGMAAAVIGN